ncbi:MAG: hypothetical protein PSX37_08720, partial [bacterium]|nr:hypothetical protein [bacterium]
LKVGGGGLAGVGRGAVARWTGEGEPVTADEGTWTVRAVDGADVRLRSGRIGLMSVDVSAPVTAGDLQVDGEQVRLRLTLALDKLRTNFVMQGAARSLIKRNNAHALTYSGNGRSGQPWQVNGAAVAGDVTVALSLTVTPVGPANDPMSEIELVGSAELGTIHLPLPGLGTVDNFAFDVDARLALGIKPV